MSTIVISDESAVSREHIRATLEAESGYDVVAEAAGRLGTLSAVAASHPDVLVLTFDFQQTHGLEITRWVRMLYPATGIVVICPQANAKHAFDLFCSGAQSIIQSGRDREVLLTSIQEALAGRRYLDAALGHLTQRNSDSHGANGEGRHAVLVRQMLLKGQAATDGVRARCLQDTAYTSVKNRPTTGNQVTT